MRVRTERIRRGRWAPILLGAIAGLLGGLVGAGLDANTNFFLPGGLLGAVTGGVVAAGVSDHGVVQDTAHAALADLASSLLFFVLVYLGLASNYEELVGVVAFSALYLLFGTAVALPIAAISLVVAGTAGLLTTLGKRGVRSALAHRERS